jgi:hypothetical protein
LAVAEKLAQLPEGASPYPENMKQFEFYQEQKVIYLVEANLSVGDTFMLEKNLSEAIQYYDKVLSLLTENPTVYTMGQLRITALYGKGKQDAILCIFIVRNVLVRNEEI